MALCPLSDIWKENILLKFDTDNQIMAFKEWDKEFQDGIPKKNQFI